MSKNVEEVFGYTTFQGQNQPLRALNQYITIKNIGEAIDNHRAKLYYNRLPKGDQTALSHIATNIYQQGIKKVRSEVLSTVGGST